MNLVHFDLESKINLSSEIINLLIVENPAKLYEYVLDFLNASLNEKNNYIFVENDKELNFQSFGDIILSPFSMSINDTKTVNALRNKLNNNYIVSKLFISFGEISSAVETFFEELFDCIEVSLDSDCLELPALLKACNVRIKNEGVSLVEKMINYMDAMSEIRKTVLFVFVGFRSFLSDYELKQLYKHSSYKKYSLLLIEGSKPIQLIENEKATIITDDLCEIVETYKKM